MSVLKWIANIITSPAAATLVLVVTVPVLVIAALHNVFTLPAPVVVMIPNPLSFLNQKF